MVKAVEDTARVNYFTVLDCLEDTFRSVKLSQIAVAVLGAASDLVDPIRTCLRPTLPERSALLMAAIAADAACLGATIMADP